VFLGEIMSATFKHRLLVWLWNLLNAVVSGSAAAGGVIGIGKAAGAVTFTFRQLGAVAISCGIVAGMNYLRTNRLPSIDK